MQQLGKMGALTLLCVASLTIMVGCVLAPGLPTIAAGLGVPDGASWLITLPSLGVVLFAPLAGRLIDRLGARRALCLGLFLYGLLGFCGQFLHGALPVFTDRILLGGVTAVVMSAGTALISEFYQGVARLAMIARQGMAIELGGVMFLAAGGLLATRTWQGPFTLYMMSWIFLAMVWWLVPATHAPVAGDDTVMTPASATQHINDVYFTAALSMVAFFVGIIVLPLQLHAIGISEAGTGYFLAMISLVAVAAAAAMPAVVRRLHQHGTLALAFVLYTGAHVLFAAASGLPAYLAGAVLMGCGFGLSIPLVNHMTVECSHPRWRARNLAYLSMALFLGQFVTSFLTLIPGAAANVFACTAGLAILSAGVFVVMRLRLRQRPGQPHGVRTPGSGPP